LAAACTREHLPSRSVCWAISCLLINSSLRVLANSARDAPLLDRGSRESVPILRPQLNPRYGYYKLKRPFCMIVGGVASPLLANIYMHRFLKYWRQTGRAAALQASVVNYADDFVILSRGHAAEALTWTRQVMTKLGLALNEAKTSVRDARQESFDFLGYTFGPQHYRKDGHWYLGASPSKKSVQRLKDKVGAILVSGNQAPWPEVCERLNSVLSGGSAYFRYGTRLMAYRAIDHHTSARVRRFLVQRHKVPTRGTRRFSSKAVFGELGVLQLRRVHYGAASCAVR
jgi:RNA-directed DNA polymerase